MSFSQSLSNHISVTLNEYFEIQEIIYLIFFQKDVESFNNNMVMLVINLNIIENGVFKVMCERWEESLSVGKKVLKI